jgi:hypothetical protein
MTAAQTLLFPEQRRKPDPWDRPPQTDKLAKQAERGRKQQQRAIDAARRQLSLRTLGDNGRVVQRMTRLHQLEVMRLEGADLEAKAELALFRCTEAAGGTAKSEIDRARSRIIELLQLRAAGARS